MKISIRKRLAPFTHKMGAQCLIPGTSESVMVLPNQIQIGTTTIPIERVSSPFSLLLQQDLERNCVIIQTPAQRVKIAAIEQGFQIWIKSRMGLAVHQQLIQKPLLLALPKKIERLSLGCHKALNWDLISHKMPLRTVLPVLYMLCQKTPCSKQAPEIASLIETICHTTFHGINVPFDLGLFPSLFQAIRSLFIEEKQNCIQLLVKNPFPEGRLLGIRTQFGFLDIEWTKYQIKRAILYVDTASTIYFQFARQMASFRLQGKRVLAQDPLVLKPGQTLFLDRIYESAHC